MGSNFLYSSQSLEGNDYFLESEGVVGLNQDHLTRLWNQLECSSFANEYWEHIRVTLFNNSPPPLLPIVQEEVGQSSLKYLSQKGAQPLTIRQFSQLISTLYQQTFEFFADKSPELILTQLSDIDSLTSSRSLTEDYTDISTIDFVKNMNLLFKEIKETVKHLNLKCVRKEPLRLDLKSKENTPFLIQMKNSLHPLVYGARKVMMTAYQSCEVIHKPLIPESYSGVQGILETPLGNRTLRNISSLSQLQNSHYYLHDIQLPARQCFNIHRSPLIYDYGGKPYVTQYPYPKINLFKNTGSGSKSLGIDCSGFVMAAMGSSGLRTQQNTPLRGVNILGLSSFHFRKPSERLNCFRTIDGSYTHPLLSGDVIASLGHVLIVDQISKDPLGLSKITSPSHCAVSKISLENLNFSVIQSSASFNGIGINRVHIRRMEQKSLIQGLKSYVSHLCYKKFNQNRKKEHGITLLRHTLSKECQENEMYLEKQNCLSHCSI